MRMGEVVHKEPQDAVDCLTSFARRLVANGYFQYEQRGEQRIFRATAINFHLQAPHFDSKDKHPLVMQLTPHEPILYGYFADDLTLGSRLQELYQVIRTGDVASIKRDNYQRRNDDRRDFTYKGRTFDDLTNHCNGLLEKGYDRPRVVAFWRTIKNQYYPNYEANMTQLTVEARETGLGFPEQVRHVHDRLTRGRRTS